MVRQAQKPPLFERVKAEDGVNRQSLRYLVKAQPVKERKNRRILCSVHFREAKMIETSDFAPFTPLRP